MGWAGFSLGRFIAGTRAPPPVTIWGEGWIVVVVFRDFKYPLNKGAF